MQKNLLQPLPALVSPSLVFQCLFCFSPLFCFNASFLLQRLFSFLFFSFFSVSAPPSFVLLFFFHPGFSLLAPPFLFFFQPKTCYSPKSPLNLSNSCVPLYQDEVKPLASRPRGTHFSCQFSSQKKKKKSSFSLHSSKTQYSLQLLRLFYLNKSSFSLNLQ